jgi:hypothetical protein
VQSRLSWVLIELIAKPLGLRTIHHRDTERTEDAQRKKNENLKLGSTHVILYLNYRYDDYNQWLTNDPPQRHRAHGGRTEKKKRKFKVGLKHMLYYVGIIDMMIITLVYGRPPWGKRAQRKSKVNFKSQNFIIFFVVSVRSL